MIPSLHPPLQDPTRELGLELDIEAAEVVTRGYEQGLILVNAGPNVLRLVPPLVITEDEIHEVAARLARV